MLYLILPPIIIIAALVALVYFFSKRFPRVEQEIVTHLSTEEGQNIRGLGARIFDSVKRVSLYVLERLAQWFKVMSLKSYNALHHWTQSLREKKFKYSAGSKASAIVSKKVIGEIIEEKDVETETGVSFEPMIIERRRRPRPMISQRVTHPEEKKKPPVIPVPVIKNQLEDILVERIAANPRDLEAYERLGEYYMEQGNLQDAKECYRQVLRLSPVHRLAKIKIRRLEKMLEQK